MAWLAPSPVEWDFVRQLANDPARADFYRLAQVLALAARVEPLLLRNARLYFMPRSDAELEIVFWFSDIMSSRSVCAAAMRTGIARALSDTLRQQDTARYAEAQRVITENTRHWSEADRLEQRMRWAVLESKTDEVEQGLRRILKTLMAVRDPKAQRDVARWAKAALPGVVSREHGSVEAGWVQQFVAATLGSPGAWLADTAKAPLPPNIVATLPRVEPSLVALKWSAGGLEFVQPDGSLPTLEVALPLPTPVLLDFDGADASRWEGVWIGRRISVRKEVRRITLQALDGVRLRLELLSPTATTQPEGGLLDRCDAPDKGGSEEGTNSTSAVALVVTPREYVQWHGVNNVHPVEGAGYDSIEHQDVRDEFYVDEFARHSNWNQGWSRDWLLARLQVTNSAAGVLSAGMLVRYCEANIVKEYLALGFEVENNCVETGFAIRGTDNPSYAGGPQPLGFRHEVVDFAFFVDIQRARGDIVRLWHSRGGRNYTLSEVFEHSSTRSSGKGSAVYAHPNSVVFDVKQSYLSGRDYLEAQRTTGPLTHYASPESKGTTALLRKAEVCPSASVPGWYGAEFEVETDGTLEGERVVIGLSDQRTVHAYDSEPSRLVGSKKKTWRLSLPTLGAEFSHFTVDLLVSERSGGRWKGNYALELKGPFPLARPTLPGRDLATEYWATRPQELLNRKLSQMVRLAWAELIPDLEHPGSYNSARIYVEVQNIAYRKRVFLQSGETTIQAAYYCTVSNGREIWRWESAGDQRFGSHGKWPSMAFVVGYEVAGRTHWDDDEGSPYVLDSHHPSAPR